MLTKSDIAILMQQVDVTKAYDQPTAAAVDIRADYVAKNGNPNAAAPKVFFRYYYVNSSTGERSGTTCWRSASGLRGPNQRPSSILAHLTGEGTKRFPAFLSEGRIFGLSFCHFA